MSSENSFPVQVTGETLDGVIGDEIPLTYIQVLTPYGYVRMTAEEAEDLGRRLISASEYERGQATGPFASLLAREISPMRLYAIRRLARQLMASPDDTVWCISVGIEQLCTGVVTPEQALAQAEV